MLFAFYFLLALQLFYMMRQVFLFVRLWFINPVPSFSRQSHIFPGINVKQYYGELMCLAQGQRGLKPGHFDSVFDALPLGHKKFSRNQVWIILENHDRNYRADEQQLHVLTGGTYGYISQ